MNPDVKESEMPTVSSPDFAEPALPPAGGTTDPLLLPPQEMNTESNEQLKQVVERFKAVLSSLPEYLSDFFSEYKRPLITLGLILGGVITVKLTFALLDAVDDIPLLAPTFELIGFGYTAWFVYRYLLKASTRQELAKDVGELKDQIVGNLPK
ncbi:MAG: CAAD domain-containing protein [Leptolyngbyaceae cyanobacterium bins.349]|nr:CAAD domain-containing protein [Leptolyngbyaceae cyanobacterium bins.349]